MSRGRLSGRLILLVPMMLLVLCYGSRASEPVSLTVGKRKITISGPYTHENLTVFLLHGKDQSKEEYLTLDEGLSKKVVSVTEKQREQVRELEIENKSTQYLFLQEGDRLTGGKQDRVVITSLVIPPKSGPMTLPTFCIEQSRWKEGKNGRYFDSTDNPIFAAQSVRLAAKVIPNRRGQSAVWHNVRMIKEQANSALQAPNYNSSLNETLDSKQVQQLCQICSAGLGKVLQKNKDAIGAAVAINGEVEEVNIYPNQQLLKKIYPRLVQSYAVQAALCKKDNSKKKAPEVTAEAVKSFILQSKAQNRDRVERIDTNNSLSVQEIKNQIRCITIYKGEPIHQQWWNGEKLKAMPIPRGRGGR